MGNICMGNKLHKKITIAVLGIDNAGKTCLLKCLQGQPLDDVTPTVGFDTVNLREGQSDVTMYDLGGGVRIRDIWKNYFPELHGLLFVIDGQDSEDRLNETNKTFQELIQNEYIQGKPILIFVNKQDLSGAIDEVDVTERFSLQILVNRHKCPCRVETCCATKGSGKAADPAIKAGFHWLLDWIKSHWDHLDARVQQDTKLHEESVRREKQAIAERVRRQKEAAVAVEQEQTELPQANHQSLPKLPQIHNSPNGIVANAPPPVASNMVPDACRTRISSDESSTIQLVSVRPQQQQQHTPLVKSLTLPPISHSTSLAEQNDLTGISSLPPVRTDTTGSLDKDSGGSSVKSTPSAYTKAVEESLHSISAFTQSKKSRGSLFGIRSNKTHSELSGEGGVINNGHNTEIANGELKTSTVITQQPVSSLPGPFPPLSNSVTANNKYDSGNNTASPFQHDYETIDHHLATFEPSN